MGTDNDVDDVLSREENALDDVTAYPSCSACDCDLTILKLLVRCKAMLEHVCLSRALCILSSKHLPLRADAPLA